MFPQSPTRYFKKLGDKIGIDHFHSRMLRHTNVSLALVNGADIVSVAKRVGHTDSSVTLRMYTHTDQESVKKSGNIVRSLWKIQSDATAEDQANRPRIFERCLGFCLGFSF